MIRMETYEPMPARRTRSRQPRLIRGIRRAVFSIRTNLGSHPDHRVKAALWLSVGVVIGAVGAGHSETIRHPHPSVASAAGIAPSVSRPSTARSVVVRSGDSVWSLAARTGKADVPVQYTVEKIMELNDLHADATIQPGQRLRVSQ